MEFEEPITFGPFTLDFGTARLRRDRTELELRPQAFRALKVLIQNRGRLVDFEQMIREAWDGVRVSRHTVTVTVGELKHALGESGSWITCRSKLGYCLELPETLSFIRRGRHFFNQFTRSGFDNALRCFEQAAKDGADSWAYEAISSTYIMLGASMLADPRRLYRGFLDAHNRAAALRGMTPELRMDLGFGLFVFAREPVKAAAELLAAQREKPTLNEVRARLALVYATLGRLDDALALAMEGRSSEEFFPPLAFTDTLLRLFRREFPAAVECGKKCLDLYPASPTSRGLYAEALEHSGRSAEALAQYRIAMAISLESPWIRALGARFLALNGRTTEALDVLNELQAKRATEYVDAYHLALLLDALGKRDEAFAELDRASEEYSYMVLLLNIDPKTDALRKDPRFARLGSRLLGGS